MKTIKRTLAVLLTLLMLATVMPLGVFNASAVNSTWTINSTTDITETNAKISGKVTFSQKIKCTEGGFYLGTTESNLKKNANPDKNLSINSTYITLSFLMSKYKETLVSNQTYYYQLYVIANGTQYTSPVKSFKTTSGATWKLNSVTNLSTTDAKISCRVDYPQSRTCTESGFYIGTTTGNMHKNAYPDKNLSIKSSYITSSFLMSKYKETLTPNTTYYYKFYVVMNGTTYTSPNGSFKTLPNQTGKYTLSYNANGGSGAPSSQTGGSTYKIPTTTPTRSGYKFLGWSTSSSASSASYEAGSSITISKNTTLYAVWGTNNIYNLKEETYGFDNYRDNDANGHCFGMSITSSAYYLERLNIQSTIGISSSNKLYTAPFSQTVKKPICFYQNKQGSYAYSSMVAGGSYYKGNYKKEAFNPSSDWTQVVNYVKNHSFDNKGEIQIIFWGPRGGHAVNFLYYKEVNGQSRLYAYDNNFPNTEVYFYKGSDGKINEAPSRTNVGEIGSISLHSVPKYLSIVTNFKDTRVIYAREGEIQIEGVEGAPLAASLDGETYYMYEIPDHQNEVTIIPIVDNASFDYLDEEFSFGLMTDVGYGVFTLVSDEDVGISQGAALTIYEKDNEDSTDVCKWCGKTHEGFFGGIIGFFHKIFAALFGARY